MKTLNCVCFPDKQSSKRIRKIMESVSRECNSRNALEFPPHFSLRNDFKVKDNDIENLFFELANILRVMSPHYIHLLFRLLYNCLDPYL